MIEIDRHVAPTRNLKVKNIVLFVALVSACLIFVLLRQVFLLSLAAIIIAILLSDAAKFVKKTTGLSRFKAFGLACVLMIACALALSWIFGAQVSNQIGELAAKLPSAVSQLEQQLNSYPAGQFIVSAATKEFESAGSSLAGLAARAGGLAFGVFDVVIQSIVVISAAIFLASNPKPYRGSLLRLLPKSKRRLVQQTLDRSGRSISGWMVGTLISMSITTCLVLACLLIFGVPAPIALALLAGLSQIVPVIGPVASACLGILLAATVSFEVAGGVALSYLIISQLEANVITPTILRRAVKVPPAMVLLSILVMGTLFGSLGVVLAIPMFLVLSDAIEVLRQPVRSLSRTSELPAEPG